MFGSASGMSRAAQEAVAQRGTPSTLNLDDIFGDVVFTPEGDTVFLSEQGGDSKELMASGEGDRVVMGASKAGTDGTLQPVARGGGLYTTHLMEHGQVATQMGTAGEGAAPTPSVPFQRTPQQKHHLSYAAPSAKPKKKTESSSARSSDRKMSEQQKVERRERNREHAKRSRIRKKFLLESLQQSVSLLKEENEKLRTSIRSHLGEERALELLNQNKDTSADGLLANSQTIANKVLDDPDFSFIKALQTAQQNFVVTDPSLPDNPIVYASQGFLNLTGYSLDQILGRNCRFLQGPETDPKSVERIRKAIEKGHDMSVCLLNYRVDGTTFWNQFFIAALRDAAGNVTNFVGVQCKVSDQYAATVTKQQEEEENGDF
jgi:PAS domain S-box-containing protein